MKSTATLLTFITAVAGLASVCVGGCPPGAAEVKVQDIDGKFCVPAGFECGGDLSGDCPRSQPGLPYGSYCEMIDTDIFGCVALDSETIQTYQPTVSPPTCGDGEIEVSVEGFFGAFCVADGHVCSDASTDGDCPGPQTGLSDGSYCDVVASGHYGCKPLNGTDPMNLNIAPPRDCTGNADGDISVSVEHVGSFCAEGPICAGYQFGNCPLTQEGLTADSSCVIVSTGVLGCAVIGE